MGDGERAGGSVKVNIFNQAYSLRAGVGGEERVLRVARDVDERMRQIASQLAVHDLAKVAVLTALNFADELHAYKEHYESTQPASRPQEEAYEELPAETAQNGDAGQGARGGSWFEAIFDADAFDEVGGDRMTSRLTSKLQGQRQQARREQTDDDAPFAGRDWSGHEGGSS